MTSRTISAPASATLNLCRWVAAFYVVLHHLASLFGWRELPGGFLFAFGQEAVIVFFLMSGFVIFVNEKDRALNPKGYYLRRLRRIYPLIILAMITSCVVYYLNGTLFSEFSWSELFGTLLALQDRSSLQPGVMVEPFLDNTPLWSLSYEILFYLIFPPVLAFWNRNKDLNTHIICALCVLLYVTYIFFPNHFSRVIAYFLIWWCGAMAGNAYLLGHRNIWAIRAELAWLGLLVLIIVACVAAIGFKMPGYYPFLHLRHFGSALLFVIIFFGPIGITVSKLSMQLAGLSAAFASVSYGIYVLHYPLLVQWDWGQKNYLAAGALLIGLSWFGERKLNEWLPKAPSA